MSWWRRLWPLVRRVTPTSWQGWAALLGILNAVITGLGNLLGFLSPLVGLVSDLVGYIVTNILTFLVGIPWPEVATAITVGFFASLLAAFAYNLLIRRIGDLFWQRPPGREPIPQEAPTTVTYYPKPPQPDRDFLGRDRELEEVAQRLLSSEAVAIHGMGGIGKTTFAAALVERPEVKGQFSRVHWFRVDNASFEAILDAVARVLGLSEQAALPPSEKAALLRDALAATRCLVVLDNAENAPAAERFCAEVSRHTLITSRKEIAEVRDYDLDVLSEENSVELLRRKSGQTELPPAETQEIVELVFRHPLALVIAGSQLKFTRPADLVRSLKRARLNPLVDPTNPDRSVRLSFATSYDQLTAPQQRLFGVLGVFAGDFDLKAVQAVAPATDSQDMSQLAARSLIQVDPQGGRYRLHALLRHYAREKLGDDMETYRRMVDYYLGFAEANQADHDALETELPNLLGAMDEAEMRLKDGRLVVAFADALCNPVYGVLSVRGYWGELVTRGRRALAAAQALGDEEAVARLGGNLATALQNRGEYPEAERLHQQAKDFYERVKDDRNLAAALHQLGRLAQVQGDYPQAEALYRKAQEVFERLGAQSERAAVLNQLGRLAQLRGDYPQAEGLYRQSIEIAERLGNQAGIASTLHNLGNLAYLQGDYPEAEALYRQSLEIRERLGNPAGIAATLHQLGRLAEERGDKGEAERLFRQALEIFERLGSPDAAIARRSLERVVGKGLPETTE